MPDIGDEVPLTLTVSPADGTTSASCTARLLPSGTDGPLSVSPNAGRDTWTALLPIDALVPKDWALAGCPRACAGGSGG